MIAHLPMIVTTPLKWNIQVRMSTMLLHMEVEHNTAPYLSSSTIPSTSGTTRNNTLHKTTLTTAVVPIKSPISWKCRTLKPTRLVAPYHSSPRFKAWNPTLFATTRIPSLLASRSMKAAAQDQNAQPDQILIIQICAALTSRSVSTIRGPIKSLLFDLLRIIF